MVEIRNSYAIVIGINQYAEPSWKLRSAVNDACKLTEILKDRYEYEVLQLLDEQATHEKLNHLLTAFENQTIPFHCGSKKVEPDDRVLFYFAGHGIAVRDKDDTPQGFIYSQDTIRGDNKSLVPMQQLHDALVKLGCRHLLIILDCCFAGSFRWVTRQAELSEEEMYLERYNRYIAGYAQEVITSAAYNERAADILYGFGERGEDDKNSPFAEALLEALNPNNEKNADFNKDGIITITEILKHIEDKFLDLNAGQTPGYSQLKKHDFGKYIFVIPGFDAASKLKTAPLPDEKDPRYPYKGLLSFEQEDKDKFCGRKRLQEKLARKVKSEPLTVVLGASGSGKSSLVKAGLIPDLKSTQSEFKILDPIRPSKSPLVALARVCKEIENPSTQSSKTELYREKLNKNEKADYFANKVGNWSLVHLNQKLLLVIDQFEELVTLCRNESERLKFLQQLASAIVHYPEQLRIVITLRSDYEPLIGSLFKSQLQSQIDWAKARLEVSPMTREELREAIIEPAEKIALFFEEKTQESDTHLVDQLIDEVINMPGGLPLLSFTLSELYRKFFKKAQVNEQYYRVITHKDYQELGRVTGSLTKRADEIYEKLKIENKDCAQIIKHVMLRMVSEGRGNLARRRVFMTELQYPQPFQNLVDEIIKEFTQARLFVKGRDEQENEYVEPAHDALIRGWSQLREWLEPKQAQEELAIQRRLTPAAEEWNHQKPGNLRRQIQIFNWLNYLGQRNEQANYLWNANPYLDILKKILNSPDNWFNQLETEFVQLSIQKRTNNWRLRWGLIVTAFTVVSGFAFIQWCESRNAETGRLAALSEASFNSNQQLEALINSLKAGKQLQLPIGIKDVTKSQTMTALQQAVYSIRERNRLQGHRNTIRNVSFSPNGQIIASGSADNTIKLWDLQGLEINTLKGHQDLVNSVSFSPNGQMLASASYDKTIKLWSINGKLLSDIPQAHKAEVYGVSFSPDGKMLVSASWDGTIKLWSIRDRHLKFFKTVELPLKIIEANKKDGDTPKPYSFHGVSFSPDGKLIAAGNEDQNVRIWNRDGKLLKTLQGHSERVYGVSFSPNGKMLASFSGDNTIILWNPLDGKKLRTLIGHKSDVYSTMFSPDSKTLISGSNDNTIKFWRVEDGKEIKTLAAHSNAVRSVNISPDGKMLVSGSIDSTIKLWSVDSEDAIALTRYRKKVNSISFSPNSNTIATGSSDFTSTKNGNLYQIKLWRKSDGRELRTLAEHESEIISTSFSPDGQILASGDTGGNIILWNPANGKILKKWKAHEENIHGLSFSPDGKLLASASHDKTIKLWDRKGQLLTELPKQENKVLSVSFSPDSKMIAWGSLRTITLWNLEQHKVIKTLEGHDKGFINSLSFSSNGLILASGGEDTMVKLWSIPDGKELHKLEGHTAGINSVSFHPNSDILASASDDKTIKLWNIKQGKEISTLKGHSAPVYGVSFSPDRLTLGSASADSTALLWNTELFDLNVALARGCKWVNNYLNNPEIGKSDQDICDNVSETNLKVKISSGDKNLVPTRPYPDKLAGIDAFIDGKLDIAAKHLQNYLNKNPNDPEALIYKNNAEINQQKSYTIAVSVPLGSNVNGALEILRGVAQAQNEINLAGGINGVKLRVLIADDENNPTVARQVAKELVKNTAVLGVIGNYASDIAQVTSKVYSDNKLVAIYPVSTSVNLAMGNYLFRTVPSDKQASLALAEYMQHQLNKQKVAIFYNSKSEYSRSFKSEFERTLKLQQIVSVFDFSAEDFKADRSVNSLLKAGAEVLVLLPDTEKLNQTLEVLNENAKRPKLPVLGGDSLYSPAILEIGADNAKDTILSVPWNWETARLSGSKFTSSSQHLWHGSVSWRTAMSYDATIALIAALQKKNTREGVAQVLQAKDFSADGASGKIRFVNGERAQNSQLVKVQRKGKSRSGYDYDFVPLP